MAVTADMSVSLDLVAAGEDQTLEQPFGGRIGENEAMHAWKFDHGEDNAAEISVITAAGAFIKGRHMFGPDHGDWDLAWRGWWGRRSALPRARLRALLQAVRPTRCRWKDIAYWAEASPGLDQFTRTGLRQFAKRAQAEDLETD